MPELPEVETVARQLDPLVRGRHVKSWRILDERLRTGEEPPLAGREILGAHRVGKQVVIDFSPRRTGDAPTHLLVHLRMTGRLSVAARGERVDPAHLRARFRLDRGSLLFHDTRRFGTFRFVPNLELAQPDGLDPFDRRFTPSWLSTQLERSRQALKVWLLRQDRIVGIGNIYASEILFAARLAPDRTTDSLNRSEVRKLHGATRRILARAIEACGTTFSDFQDAYGVTGSYQQYLRVYGRDGERCKRCAGSIEKSVQAQRSTFACSGCQS